MSRLKQKHPNRDFFILDIADVVPKDDLITMEHPLFSLATKPDMRTLEYERNGQKLVVIPSGNGLATIHDKDVLIWAISKIIHAKNRGEPYSRRVTGTAHDLLASTNRPTNNLGYKRLKQTFIRLRGTTFQSDIPTGGKRTNKTFGLVDEATFEYDEETRRASRIEIVLSEWMFRAVDAFDVVSISEDYFLIRKPLERRLYEIGRKFCGNSTKWEISLPKLQILTGSNAPAKRFRHNVRQIIEDDHTPFYRLELTERDNVIYRPRMTRRKLNRGLVLPSWAEEKAKEICVQKGWDYHGVLEEWQDFALSGDPPKNPGGAFIGFVKKKPSLR